MRIEFLTQDDPLYILPFFDEFLRNYSSEFEVLQISCCPTMGKRSRLQLLRELAALYGIGGFTDCSARLQNRGSWASCPGAAVPVSFYSLEQLAASL